MFLSRKTGLSYKMSQNKIQGDQNMKKYIGCSGFHYAGWKNKFYPEDIAEEKWLPYYAKHFNTVEINNTFYSMPEKESLQSWIDLTPDHFKFTVKANRFFTHMKKLKLDDSVLNSLQEFQDTVSVLDNKLGCILWQLPSNLHKNTGKLNSFSEALDMSIKHVLEFRHDSWFSEDVFNLLEENEIAFCILSAPELPDTVRTTTNFAYMRFHGTDEWYDYHYSDNELNRWKKRLDEINGVKELYIYFNNDPNAWSAENAEKLKSIL